mgnify:CR=1 FL=1
MSFDEIMGGIVPKDDKDYIGKSLIDIYELDEAKIMTRVERLIDMSESSSLMRSTTQVTRLNRQLLVISTSKLSFTGC